MPQYNKCSVKRPHTGAEQPPGILPFYIIVNDNFFSIQNQLSVFEPECILRLGVFC